MDPLLESALNAAALRPDRDATAYNEGRAAFLAGYSDNVNRYQPNTALYEAWLDGWDDMCAEAMHPYGDRMVA